jgi:predicted nucleic acid-binding Zn ribbon protein
MNEPTDTKLCHFCKEPINKDAKVCKHCGKKQPNNTRTIIYAAIILLFITGLLVNTINGTVAPITSDTPSAPGVTVAPTVLLNLSGSGSKSTQTFTTSSNEWTLQYAYNCSGAGGNGNFIAQVMSADGSMSGLIGPNEIGAKGTDIENYHQGGTYYLEINSECDWKVQVKG